MNLYNVAWLVDCEVCCYNSSNQQMTIMRRSYCVIADFEEIQNTLNSTIKMQDGQERLESILNVSYIAERIASQRL